MRNSTSEADLEALDLYFVEEETSFGVTTVPLSLSLPLSPSLSLSLSLPQHLTQSTCSHHARWQHVDLLHGGGAEERVTLGNRSVYVRLLTHHLLTSKIDAQIKAARRGLLQIVPAPLLTMMQHCFSADEIRDVIAGQPTLCLEEWKRHTSYRGGYDSSSQPVSWFWQLMSRWSNERRSDVLAMVTGCRHIPPGGFRHLSGYNNQVQGFEIRRGKHPREGAEWPLPSAATCFNTLTLPPYESLQMLTCKLERALDEHQNGGAFHEEYV